MHKLVNGVEVELSEAEILEYNQREEDHSEYIKSLEYRQKIAVEQRIYKPIQEQLDMLYKDAKNGTSTWVEYIDSIKASYPKPLE